MIQVGISNLSRDSQSVCQFGFTVSVLETPIAEAAGYHVNDRIIIERDTNDGVRSITGTSNFKLRSFSVER